MVISRRSRVALHAVGYLAFRRQEIEGPIPMAEIRDYLRAYSQHYVFSAGHVSKIFQELCRAGVMRATPGRNGGYLLARPADDIRLVEIVRALDGGPDDDCCLLSIGPCENRLRCGVNRVIRGAESSFYEFLERESAESLARKMFAEAPPPNLRSVAPRTTPER